MMRYVFLLIYLADMAVASTNFDQEARMTYLSQAILDISRQNASRIESGQNFVDSLDRRCGSSFVEIKIKCLIESTRSFCQQTARASQSACHRFMDILLANRSHESHFLSKRERYEIMRDHKNFRRVFAEKLTQRYGTLTTRFVMSPYFDCRDKHQPCFTKSIDEFCMHMNHEGKLSWQTCAAAIVWFVAKPSFNNSSP